MIMAILAMNRRRLTNTPIAAAMNQYVGVRARGRRVSILDLIVRLDWTLRRVQEDQTNENSAASVLASMHDNARDSKVRASTRIVSLIQCVTAPSVTRGAGTVRCHRDE
jgi:hypothetical protein